MVGTRGDMGLSRLRLCSSYLMQTLRPQAPEVPHHVRVLHVGLRVPLLGVDEGRELHGEKVIDTLPFLLLMEVNTQVLNELNVCDL